MNTLIKTRRRLTFSLLILGAISFSACNNPVKKRGGVDSAVVESISVLNDSAEVDTIAAPTAEEPKAYNQFKVNSHEVMLPHLSDFDALISLFPSTKAIKEISFYSLSPSSGLGSMGDDYEPFMQARNIKSAKAHSTEIASYSFDRNGNVTEAEFDSMEEYEFTYDSEGHPTRIVFVTEGYRGAPSYTEKYTLSWDENTPVSMKRKILNYEDNFEEVGGYKSLDEKVPYTYNFQGDFPGNIVKAINKNKPTIQGNSCKIPESKWNDFPIWCEIEYYN